MYCDNNVQSSEVHCGENVQRSGAVQWNVASWPMLRLRLVRLVVPAWGIQLQRPRNARNQIGKSGNPSEPSSQEIHPETCNEIAQDLSLVALVAPLVEELLQEKLATNLSPGSVSCICARATTLKFKSKFKLYNSQNLLNLKSLLEFWNKKCLLNLNCTTVTALRHVYGTFANRPISNEPL